MKNDLFINPEIKQIGYKNHDALLIWLDRLLEESDRKLTKQEIRKKFFEKIPESMANY